MTLKSTLLSTPSASAWEKIGVRHHHGIDLPLSALRSKNSCGIGEFLDLIPLIDWCQHLKFDVIQLLPLNQSGPDPSPYTPLSSCALHFAYLSLHALPFFKESDPTIQQLRRLNDTDQIEYAKVIRLKKEWLLTHLETTSSTDAFKAFTEEQSTWLKPYALFQALSEHFKTAQWETWKITNAQKTELYSQYAKEILFHSMVQFLCYSQLKEAKAYANKKNIFLMGDIPILVNRDSVDVWNFPEYFDLKLAAGAPPDQYGKEGQYWGFPLFQWEALRKNGYDWWKTRLSYAEHFFDIFRIDHIVGFFRIWGIPLGEKPKKGHFIPKEEEKWEPLGKELLTMILSSTKMLSIGEDLGTVLDFMRKTMQTLGICGTKIMRWERDWKQKSAPFTRIEDYPPISLTSVSTHDSPTLSLWWTQFPKEAKAYAKQRGWEYKKTLTEPQRKAILFDSHHTASLFHINLLQEYLALFPELVREDPQKERINIPGVVLPSNWTYRFKPSIEEMISHPELSSCIAQLLPGG